MKYTAIFVLFLIPLMTMGQNDPSPFWEHFSVESDSLGTVVINVTKESIDEYKPLLIFLEGSGNFPLFFKSKDGKYRTGITLDYKKRSSDYHIAIISKPGIPFIDSLSYSRSGRRYYPKNPVYNKYYSLYWRAKSASLAIDYLVNNLAVDTTRIVVMGHSEGSQVAPAVAAENRKVTHVISMMGNSLNQLYDFLIQERINVEKGTITALKAQQNIDSLYHEYEKIYSEPNSVDKTWFGETYYKWTSFTLKSPIEYMLELDVPILYIGGGLDSNQNVINMDFARLEFLRKGKRNLTYKVFPNYDHYFQEKNMRDGKIEYIDRIDDVNDFVFEWIKPIGK